MHVSLSHIDWNPYPLIYGPIIHPSVETTYPLLSHICQSVCVYLAWSLVYEFHIQCTAVVVLGPPEVYIPWPSNACTWSVWVSLLVCAPFPVTPPPGIPPISGRVLMTPHTFLPPLLRGSPHGSISWPFNGFSSCSAVLMMLKLSLRITHNLSVSSPSPWAWILLLSPIVYTPPHLDFPRWIWGFIPSPLSYPGSSSGQPSKKHAYKRHHCLLHPYGVSTHNVSIVFV